MKKWLQSREYIYAKKYTFHLSNQEAFNFSEDRECFEKLNDLINHIYEKKNPEDIIISGHLPFNKTGSFQDFVLKRILNELTTNLLSTKQKLTKVYC